MPEIPNVVLDEVIESEWGNDIRDRSIQRYADAAARTSLHASPVNGDLSFLNSTGKVYVYHSGSWRTMYDNLEGSLTGYLKMGGTVESTPDTSVTTSYETGTTLTFSKPAGWTTFSVFAWTTVTFNAPSGPSGLPRAAARVGIGGVEGPIVDATVPATNTTLTLPANYERGGLTADVTVSARYAELTAVIEKLASAIQYIAIRTA